MSEIEEIIARAYDKEDAAQMGEPDPWAVNADGPWRDERVACAEAAIEALEAVGYVITRRSDEKWQPDEEQKADIIRKGERLGHPSLAREAYEAGYRDGYAAGKASER